MFSTLLLFTCSVQKKIPAEQTKNFFLGDQSSIMNICHPFRRYVLCVCVCVCEWLMLSWLSTQYRGAKRIYSPLIFSLVVSEGHAPTHTHSLSPFILICLCLRDRLQRALQSFSAPFIHSRCFLKLQSNAHASSLTGQHSEFFFFGPHGPHFVFQKSSSLSQMRCNFFFFFFLLRASGNTARITSMFRPTTRHSPNTKALIADERLRPLTLKADFNKHRLINNKRQLKCPESNHAGWWNMMGF